MKTLLLAVVVLLLLASGAEAGQGWYLMGPPDVPEMPFGLNRHAPLRNWQILDSTDRANECWEQKAAIVNGQAKLVHMFPRFDKAEHELHRMVESVCIATDDPRLAR